MEIIQKKKQMFRDQKKKIKLISKKSNNDKKNRDKTERNQSI